MVLEISFVGGPISNPGKMRHESVVRSTLVVKRIHFVRLHDLSQIPVLDVLEYNLNMHSEQAFIRHVPK